MPSPVPYLPTAHYPVTRDDLTTEAASIPQRFEQMVERNPDKVAVLRDDDVLTYTQLNRLANRLAHAIRAACGPAPGAVLIVFDRSPAVTAAIMGVLKAGKFYVPIDMADPPARLALIAADSQAELIVTEDACLPLARSLASVQGTGAVGPQPAAAGPGPPGADCPVLNLDALDPLLPDTNLGLPLRLDDLAQIMYTSGSTGAPKGVVYTHDTVLHYIRTRNVDPRVAPLPSDRTMMLTSLSVLGGSARIYWAVLTGGSVAVYNLKAGGLVGLADWLRANQITLYQSSPTVFRHFVATLSGPLDLPVLRCVKLIGEPVARQDVELFKKYFPPPCLLQVTIATTECRAFAEYVAGADTEPPAGRALLGYAAYDAQVAIWDEEDRDCGKEQVGEIVVRSEYLARGYWRRPDLTASVFLPDPAGGSARLYRTGDLGLLRPDGMLEHHGRKDFQVKIRGNRVELGEIEMALYELEHIREAVVVARPDAAGETQLVAYVVPERIIKDEGGRRKAEQGLRATEQMLSAGDAVPAPRTAVGETGGLVSAGYLRRRLSESLPAFMLPAAFVILPELPLTASGKIDRAQLPVPELARGAHAGGRDVLEEQLAQLWADVLHLPRVGIDEDFFELGGNSLLAMRLFADMQHKLGRTLPLSVLFEAGTVAELAALIRADRGPASGDACLVPIQPRGTRRPFFLAAGGAGDDGVLLIYARFARFLGPDQPFYGLRARTVSRGRHANAEVEAIAAGHVAEIRAVQPSGPYLLGGECIGGMVAVEMARQLCAAGEEVALLCLLDTVRPTWRIRLARSWLRRRAGEALRFVRALGRLEIRLPHGARHDQTYGEVIWRYHARGPVKALTLLVSQEYHRTNPTLGWGALAPGMEVHALPGTHESYIRQNIETTGTCLRACLDRAQYDRAPNRVK